MDMSQSSRGKVLVQEPVIMDFLTEPRERYIMSGAQWLSGRVLDLRPRCRGFEPHRRHFVVVLVVLEQDTFILA